MEQKRPKARGIEEIAHFFFSSKADQARVGTPPETKISAKIFALLSLVEDLPTSLFTTNLAIELTYRQKKVLLADTGWGPMNIFFALGIQRPFTPIEQFLRGLTREVVATGPLGIRLFTFPLEPGRVALLRSIEPGGLFQSLIREERRNDLLLVNICPPSRPFSQPPALSNEGFNLDLDLPDHGAAQIFSEALEILLLIPSDHRGLKYSYRFVKSLFYHHPRSRIGILLYHMNETGEADEIFGALAEAATRFLGRKIRGYGHLADDPQLYLSLVQGKPLCRRPVRDQNATVLAQMAKRISEEISDDAFLKDLIRTSGQQLLLEALSKFPDSTFSNPAHPKLSIEEETFFDRQWGS